jgi:hypothetical protein
MSKHEEIKAIQFSHIENDQRPWIAIAQQILAKPHAKLEEDYMKSCVIGLRSINDPDAQKAVEILNSRLSKKKP